MSPYQSNSNPQLQQGRHKRGPGRISAVSLASASGVLLPRKSPVLTGNSWGKPVKPEAPAKLLGTRRCSGDTPDTTSPRAQQERQNTQEPWHHHPGIPGSPVELSPGGCRAEPALAARTPAQLRRAWTEENRFTRRVTAESAPAYPSHFNTATLTCSGDITEIWPSRGKKLFCCFHCRHYTQ